MTKNRYYSGAESDHFDGVRFFNPSQPSTDRSWTDVLRWRRERQAAQWPQSVSVTTVRPQTRRDDLAITMVGHASLLIQVSGVNILTDPVWSERASPFSFIGPKRVAAPGVNFDDLPPIDAVLISHCHYDHLDVATLRRLQTAHDPLMIMPLGNDAIVRAAAPKARIVVGDWSERLEISARIGTTLTRANHWSARGPRDRRMALWCGHFIDTPVGAIWFAGDTGYEGGAIFRDIRRELGAPDVALIPIGAYEPRWFMAPQHVNPEEAVCIFRDVGALQALGMHWGVFQLTDEARDAPRIALGEALAAANMPAHSFVAMEPGASFVK